MRRQRADQPEQAAADHARGAVGWGSEGGCGGGGGGGGGVGGCSRKVSMEFSIARRKLVSATSACWACMRRRVWRQLAISIQAVMALSAPDQPEQAAADHAQRGAVGLRAQHQAVAHRRHRHFVFVGLRWPRAAAAWPGCAAAPTVPASTRPLPSSSATAYLAEHLGRHAVAQQAVDRVFAQHHAGELALVGQRHVQLQQAGAVACRRRAASTPAAAGRAPGCRCSRSRPARSTSPATRSCAVGRLGAA